MVGMVNLMANATNLAENTLNPQNQISVLNSDTYELNIQPAASILNVFSRLSYKVWYAIAEFVDNSTQSFISNADELYSSEANYKLVVEVKYDQSQNTLTITDNAFGMEIDNFRNAILLDSRNPGQTGRNEFGMGLKTAASWFGNMWTVTSSQFGSENQYSATVDILKLKNEGLNCVQIHRTSVEKELHGTTIFIQDVTKKITGPRTVGKIRDLLSCMYRRDINNRNIEIYFNDYMIQFEDYAILHNFRGKSWKKPLNFSVNFDGKDYHVNGFVAIMNPGSFTNSGFALFRQDRVVIGGPDLNYKPTQIFGQVQSQRSLKLFGELNMDDFPVNQAKDGFVWDDGLEDAFIEELRSNIQDYIEIADLSKKERESEEEFTPEKSDKLKKDVEVALKNMIQTQTQEPTGSDEKPKNNDGDILIETQEYIETVLNQPNEDKTVGSIRSYQLPLNKIKNLNINVQWAIGKKDYWIDCKDDNGIIDVIINIDHPFFKPYSKEDDFKEVLEKFVLAFVMAEQQAKSTTDKEGYILASTIRNSMNRFLSSFSED